MADDQPTYADLEMLATPVNAAEAARELRYGLRELGDRLVMCAFWLAIAAVACAVIVS